MYQFENMLSNHDHTSKQSYSKIRSKNIPPPRHNNIIHASARKKWVLQDKSVDESRWVSFIKVYATVPKLFSAITKAKQYHGMVAGSRRNARWIRRHGWREKNETGRGSMNPSTFLCSDGSYARPTLLCIVSRPHIGRRISHSSLESGSDRIVSRTFKRKHGSMYCI